MSSCKLSYKKLLEMSYKLPCKKMLEMSSYKFLCKSLEMSSYKLEIQDPGSWPSLVKQYLYLNSAEFKEII